MRFITRLAFSATIAIVASSTSFAQTTGGGQTGSGGQGGSGGVSAGLNNESNFTSIVTVPAISGITTTGRSSAISSYNAFGGTYWNPQALGNPLSANATSGATAFGTALFNTSTGGSTRTTGSAGGIGASGASGNRTTAASATGGNTTGFSTGVSGGSGTTGLTGATGLGGGANAGGRSSGGIGGASGGLGGATGGFGGATGGFGGMSTGLGGFGGAAGMGGSTNTAIVAQAGRDVSYAASFRSPLPSPYTPTRIQTDLRSMFDTSTMIGNGKTIEVLANTNGVVILRGNVRDDDEARLIEGMTRLTPGVRDVKNELKRGG